MIEEIHEPDPDTGQIVRDAEKVLKESKKNRDKTEKEIAKAYSALAELSEKTATNGYLKRFRAVLGGSR